MILPPERLTDVLMRYQFARAAPRFDFPPDRVKSHGRYTVAAYDMPGARLSRFRIDENHDFLYWRFFGRGAQIAPDERELIGLRPSQPYPDLVLSPQGRTASVFHVVPTETRHFAHVFCRPRATRYHLSTPWLTITRARLLDVFFVQKSMGGKREEITDPLPTLTEACLSLSDLLLDLPEVEG